MSEAYAGLKSKRNEARDLVKQMSREEKARFCSGKSFWRLESCERLGIATVSVADGPHGLRKQNSRGDHIGLEASVKSTCFPTASALASSWDIELVRTVGIALGQECLAEGVSVLLGPGMNIKRHPLCGRNFEYFSEDPLLNGELASAFILGVQSQGIGTSVKHFAVNNQEKSRMFIDAVVDERTLREIYLRGFEIAIKKAQPWTVMCAYNKLNGEYCSEHKWLLDEVLRQEWGFEGLVVTDWGATNDRVMGVTAGLDLEMPASAGINDRLVLEALEKGTLSESDLDRVITRNVSLSLLGAERLQSSTTAGSVSAEDITKHHKLAQRAAAESMVLLKNTDNSLPLQCEKGIAVIGAFAKQPRFQGTGSSQVTPTQLDCALDAMRLLSNSPDEIQYAQGYDPEHSKPDSELLTEAVNLAKTVEVAVVFVGLPSTYESEGFDRDHMRLPAQHDALIDAVCAANKNVIVVLVNGAPVEMPWVEKPNAILETYLAGQASGSAIADLLFGKINPSGKLAETFPLKLEDVMSNQWFPGTARQVQYREGLYVGYRYFDTAAVAVLFPFGHGLSYTQFSYSNLLFSKDEFEQGGVMQVSFDLTNTGTLAGAEVVQLYIHDYESSVYRPEQELKGFVKITLQASETKRVIFTVDDAAFAIYDTFTKAWLVESGECEVRLGASSRDIRLARNLIVNSAQKVASVQCAGPDIKNGQCGVSDNVFTRMMGSMIPLAQPVKPFHMNSSVREISQTWVGNIVRNNVIDSFRQRAGKNNTDKTVEKMYEAMANDLPLRSLALFSGGKLSFESIHTLIAVLNRSYFRALKLYIKSKLPS